MGNSSSRHGTPDPAVSDLSPVLTQLVAKLFKLTSGRRSSRHHQLPAFGGWAQKSGTNLQLRSERLFELPGINPAAGEFQRTLADQRLRGHQSGSPDIAAILRSRGDGDVRARRRKKPIITWAPSRPVARVFRSRSSGTHRLARRTGPRGEKALRDKCRLPGERKGR